MRDSPSNMIVGGDFKCVLNQTESTGYFNYIKGLDGLFRAFELQDECVFRTPYGLFSRTTPGWEYQRLTGYTQRNN
jgi:hypothetical protein